MRLHVDIEKDLRDFRLKVAFDTDGEVFALLGASGSGKSMTSTNARLRYHQVPSSVGVSNRCASPRKSITT